MKYLINCESLIFAQVLNMDSTVDDVWHDEISNNSSHFKACSLWLQLSNSCLQCSWNGKELCWLGKLFHTKILSFKEAFPFRICSIIYFFAAPLLAVLGGVFVCKSNSARNK